MNTTTPTQAAADTAPVKAKRRMNPQPKLDKFRVMAMEAGGAFEPAGFGTWAYDDGKRVVLIKSSELFDIPTFEDLVAHAATRASFTEDPVA